MPQPTMRSPATAGHISTNGVRLDAERWKRRKAEAAEAVRRRLMTVGEACEHFGLSERDLDVGLVKPH